MTSNPRERAQILEHLGPYIRHPPVAVFGEILDECFAELHAALGGDVKKDESPRQHLITRLVRQLRRRTLRPRLRRAGGDEGGADTRWYPRGVGKVGAG